LKKTGHILLLFIFLLQAGGILLIYQLRQCQAYGEMSEKLNASGTQFQKISLSLREYQKSKTGARELLIDGKLYDIKSEKISGSTIELLVINDSKEEGIWNEIKSYFNRSKQNDNFPQQLCQLLLLTYIAPEAEELVFLSPSKTISFTELTVYSESCFFTITSPPPEL
jgi:hypothetical protein